MSVVFLHTFVAILDSLRGIYPAQRILSDRVSLLAYECDGFPMHRHPPVAVVFPASTGEVQRTIRLCNAKGVAFQGRGAGTGLSGGASPSERPTVILALAAMKRILSIDAANRVAVVEPGVVNLDLSEAARPHGLYYAPDPSSQSACTLGGNVAENSGGPHCFKYGMTTDHVVAMTLVTAEGDVLELREGDGPDLCGLVTGSEGTFGIVTRVSVRLMPRPEVVRTWLAAYATMDAACQAVFRIVSSGIVPAALEILDQSTIEAVEASIYAAGYPQDAAAVLLVELDGTSVAVAADTPRVEECVRAEEPLSLQSTSDPEQRTSLWKGRKGAFGAMGRLAPDLYVLDGVVPRSRLQPVLERVIAIGKAYGVTLSNVFHAGDGNLHPNISYDGRDPVQRARVIEAGYEILKLCVDEGGSITGEHGVGSEKLDHMPLMFENADLDVFRAIKACFDPNGVCNPDKAIPSGGSCKEGRSARRPDVLHAG